MRRYSVGLLIRKREDGYEFVMEDGYYHSTPTDFGMDFKSAVFREIKKHFNVTSFWYGGKVPNAFLEYGLPIGDFERDGDFPEGFQTECKYTMSEEEEGEESGTKGGEEDDVSMDDPEDEDLE
ncbi:hypothetical protein F5Y19DRAFT_472723 [Xylariaceae sp. FL1651]|nr:hypothetical protein F5Y19DRAFT_472723 [Xylariaceae sp. FL1651]